jgi:hypothetical protein
LEQPGVDAVHRPLAGLAGLALSDLHFSSSGVDTVIAHGNDSIVLEGVHTLDASDLLVA